MIYRLIRKREQILAAIARSREEACWRQEIDGFEVAYSKIVNDIEAKRIDSTWKRVSQPLPTQVLLYEWSIAWVSGGLRPMRMPCRDVSPTKLYERRSEPTTTIEIAKDYIVVIFPIAARSWPRSEDMGRCSDASTVKAFVSIL